MLTSRIHDIVPGTGGVKIKVRVSRMWRGKVLRPVQRYDGLGCVLVDQYVIVIIVQSFFTSTGSIISNYCLYVI